MSFFPFLSAPESEGWVTVSSFPPNNWQGPLLNKSKKLYLAWSDGKNWNYQYLENLPRDKIRQIRFPEISCYLPNGRHGFLFLTENLLSESDFESSELITPNIQRYTAPEWRSSLGLASNGLKVSYQGEINPLPMPGSLLSMSPMFQVANKIKNYLLFVNLEKSPIDRVGHIEIHSRVEMRMKKKVEVFNNHVTAIDLSDIQISGNDYIIITSKDIAGIPLFFSKSSCNLLMSLEHTHPPASYGVHGGRIELQKALKKMWLEKIG